MCAVDQTPLNPAPPPTPAEIAEMQERRDIPLLVLFTVIGSLVILGVCGIFVPRLMFDRTREFRAQAQVGQPIVRAIEEFRKQTGNYPSSLTDLVPKYLPRLPDPDMPRRHRHISYVWDYYTVTNGTAVSYNLNCFMGKGGVDYDPPVWQGNDDGHKIFLFRNE